MISIWVSSTFICESWINSDLTEQPISATHGKRDTLREWIFRSHSKAAIIQISLILALCSESRHTGAVCHDYDETKGGKRGWLISVWRNFLSFQSEMCWAVGYVCHTFRDYNFSLQRHLQKWTVSFLFPCTYGPKICLYKEFIFYSQ